MLLPFLFFWPNEVEQWKNVLATALPGQSGVEQVHCCSTVSVVECQRGKDNSSLLLSERALWVCELHPAASAEQLGPPGLHLRISVQGAR